MQTVCHCLPLWQLGAEESQVEVKGHALLLLFSVGSGPEWSRGDVVCRFRQWYLLWINFKSQELKKNQLRKGCGTVRLGGN